MSPDDWHLPLLYMGADLAPADWARVLGVSAYDVRAAARALRIELAAESIAQERHRRLRRSMYRWRSKAQRADARNEVLLEALMDAHDRLEAGR